MRLNKICKLVLSCLSICMLNANANALAMPPIMPLNEVQPGMYGTAYTVVDSTGELKPIDITIVGVYDEGSKVNSSRILVKLSGPVAENVGGLLSGMSGSPVYIDGKLVGALSATLKDMNQFNGLITPIEHMLPLWNMPDKLNKTSFPSVDIVKGFEKIEKDREDFEKQYNVAEHKLAKIAGLEVAADKKKDVADKDKKEENTDKTKEKDTSEATDSVDKDKEAAKDLEKADAVETKMIFSTGGFSGRDFAFLKENLQKVGISVEKSTNANFDGSQNIAKDANLQPGSPVGVALVLGDFSMGAIGTVTAVEGKKVLAFGHPFISQGNVNFFMTDAKVIGTVSGPTAGMKMANSTQLIGRVNQDRDSGVSGILGNFPQSVPVIVNVKDKDLNKNIIYNMYMAYNEKLLPELSASLVYASLSKTIDRLSGSSAEVKFNIRTDAANGGNFERRNMFYNDSDVGKAAISELAAAMSAICLNKEKESNIVDIKVDIAVDSDRRIASLVSVVPSKKKVEPGEKIDLKVTLKPYRKEKETITIPYRVPATQELGDFDISLHGGGLISLAQLLAMMSQEANNENGAELSLKDNLDKMSESYMNNEIIIEPATVVPENDEEQSKAIKKAIKKSKQIEELLKSGKVSMNDVYEDPVVRFTSNYIIDNSIHTTLKVVKSSKK